MVRKSVTLAADVERARLLALVYVYDAIQGAASGARLYFVAGPPGKVDATNAEYNLALLAELRNQAVTLTALAPPVEIAPDAVSEQLTRMFLGMFPGLATHLPEEEYKP